MLTDCHLSGLIYAQAEKYGNRTALAYHDREADRWIKVSWAKFRDTVNQTARALLTTGIAEQENVAVFSPNMPQCHYADFACYALRAATVPLYATSSAEQVSFVINDAGIRTVFVGEQRQYDTVCPLLSVCPTLERIVIFDNNVRKQKTDTTSMYFDDFLLRGNEPMLETILTDRRSRTDFNDICNILYTSGTTGASKGVVITYAMYAHAIRENIKVLRLSEDDVFLNMLPFSHVFERGFSYLGLALGAKQAINRYPADSLKAMQQIRPTCMCAVPRFWEKVYEGVVERINNGNPLKRRLFDKAMAVGKRVCEDYMSKGREVPPMLKMKYRFYDSIVYSVVRKTLGLDRGNFFPTAGATVSREIETFVHACGINMVVGYGLTESTATVTCDQPDRTFTLGSVGRPIGGVELRISDEGEILLRGKGITPGYYRKPVSTADAFDSDGWFHTGDAGYMKDGELFLTDRIKDLYKTSNGKYIAPQQLEAKLVVDKYIDRAVIIADRYKYVSALIVPSYDALRQYADKWEIPAPDNESLCANPRINEMMADRIETLQQSFAGYEQVKRFTLLPQPFSMERGELTNTLKVRRKVVFEHYAREIEKMYE